MITPSSLTKGDTIAFASPARRISREELQFAINLIQSHGFKLKMDDEIFAIADQYAGDDLHRMKHFQTLLDDPEIKAIICTRGGYGSLRIIDQLDFTAFKSHPKWIIGYSDITVFHAQLQQKLQMESLHAGMPINFQTNSQPAIESLFDALEGKEIAYTFPKHDLNRAGKAGGMLVGGNLSILYSLVGSDSFPDASGKILFLEDLDEYLYHIDRMMLSLKRAGVLNGLSGLIVGGMNDMNDNAIPFGKSAEEIICEHVQEYDFPVCFGFPAGHISDNRALVLGRKCLLEVGENVKFFQAATF